MKSDGSDDLVFQSVKAGMPMNDGNISKRYIKPAARSLGLNVNCRSLRTSFRIIDLQRSDCERLFPSNGDRTDPHTKMTR